jgi:divalent metal cation (Fe/Co/Zn/Cd) transporter
LYHRFISNIPENFSGRFFSAFMLLVCAGCNILTAFNPLYWILFIGIGGFSVALKYYQLAVSLGFKNINSRAFRYLGNHTSCQMFVLMAIGLAAARYVRWNPSETVMANFNIISVVIAVILTLGMLSLFPGQVSWRAASTLMGLSDRSRVRSPR